MNHRLLKKHRADRGQRGVNKEKPDMAQWFIDEFHNLSDVRSPKARRLLLSGTAVSAVVAGR